ncbi:SubName: Full=Related to tetraspanin Pls1 family-Laccaria bicolor {ECO:0000313/EMBL:CCA73271.1} [Serendipita indica DSM 11827]|nr:SubName: Full=Related to tetraspanin Pls1 family-Laccaria bicolor {ECO:0000313/EMBL:CCA73271.1} [Serendipita indica DSM 11827]
MPSKTLLAVWGVIDFLLLAAGGMTIAISVLFKAPDPIRNIALTDFDLNFGLVLGIFYVATFCLSIGAILQRNHVTIGLAILNWALIADAIVTVIYGANLWYMTLQETLNFSRVWNTTTPARRIAVQEKFKCCGFLNNTAVEASGFCATPANALDNGCSATFLPLADTMLMDAFTTVYGYTAILVLFFLATMCVIKKRQETERFRQIDAKRGGGGFV